jgi:hypothetical protein
LAFSFEYLYVLEINEDKLFKVRAWRFNLSDLKIQFSDSCRVETLRASINNILWNGFSRLLEVLLGKRLQWD